MKEAVKWYRKASEQNYLNAEVQFILAECYANGDGVAKDMVEAAKWYHEAAKQYHAKSEFALGECYANGNGVEKDMEEAIKWYRVAARHMEPRAIERLAQLGQ